MPPNFRDLAEATDLIRPGLVFRSSELLTNAVILSRGIRSVLDLRQTPRECKKYAKRRRGHDSCLIRTRRFLINILSASATSERDAGSRATLLAAPMGMLWLAAARRRGSTSCGACPTGTSSRGTRAPTLSAPCAP